MKANSRTKIVSAVQFTSATALPPKFSFRSSLAAGYRRLSSSLRGVVVGCKVDDPRQYGADDHPRHLIPIEEWNPDPGRLNLVVERRPDHRDELDQEQQVP